MYRVIVNGVTIECETAEQAIELAQHASGRSTPNNPTGTRSNGASRWSARRVREFLDYLSDGQRRLIDELLEFPEGRTDQQLVASLGLKSKSALGGVFTGLIRNVKKTGASPDELYSTQAVSIGDEERDEYRLTEPFRTAAASVTTT